MPILVSAHPLFGEGVRAERAVWEVLRDQLPDEAVLFHSLRVQERQNEYEADIVVLIPGAGWAVIEVKGGDVRRRDGPCCRLSRRQVVGLAGRRPVCRRTAGS